MFNLSLMACIITQTSCIVNGDLLNDLVWQNSRSWLDCFGVKDFKDADIVRAIPGIEPEMGQAMTFKGWFWVMEFDRCCLFFIVWAGFG